MNAYYNILLVEDNPGDQRLFEELLKDAGHVEYILTHCAQLKDALAAFSNESFDIAFLDLGLPDSQGLASLNKLHSKNLSIPIVVLTGLADEETGLQALRMGAQDYLVKGCIDGSILLRIIRYSIERQKLTSQLLDSAREHIKVTGRFRLALEASDEGIWEWDVDGGKTFFSPRWKEMLGYCENELVDDFDTWLKLIHPEDLEIFLVCWNNYMNGDIDKLFIEYRLLGKSNKYHWIELRGRGIRNTKGHITHMMGAHLNITERKDAQATIETYQKNLEHLVDERTRELENANKKLEELSLTDPLTGLANRRHFEREIEIEWKRASRNQDFISLLMIDIDHFKLYNDQFGHPAGDQCLKKIASTLLRMQRRPGDLAARYGGEEFILILPHCNTKDATKLAENLRLMVNELNIPSACSDTSEWVTISIGVGTMQPTNGKNSWQELLNEADKALYTAKNDGRNQIFTRSEYKYQSLVKKTGKNLN